MDRHAKVFWLNAKPLSEVTGLSQRRPPTRGLQTYKSTIAGFGLDRGLGEKRRCCVNMNAWESVVLTIIAKTFLNHVFASLHNILSIKLSDIFASPLRSLLHAKHAGFATTPPHALFDRHALIVKKISPLRRLPCVFSFGLSYVCLHVVLASALSSYFDAMHSILTASTTFCHELATCVSSS